MLSLLRRRRAVALTVALASLALPAAAHADLVQSSLTSSGQTGRVAANGGSFDDHSIGGDNHLGWGYTGTGGTSDPEPLAVNFGTNLTVAGGTTFRVCGYPSTTPGWMDAYQVPGACPGTEPSTAPNSWFRYVTANHSDDSPPAFNRWHLMNLQRFALVPVPGSAGRAVAWDNDWGTCLGDNTVGLECTQAQNPGTLNVSIAAGATKITQEGPEAAGTNAPDTTRIAIPSAARTQFPDGQYQLVAISNPYNRFAGASNVACTNITISGYAANPEAPVVTVGTAPATCYVPAALQPAAMPGGRDPLAGEAQTTPACPLVPATGHCWAAVPTSGGNTLARTNATPANVVDASGALVPVAQGGALTVAGPTPVVTPTGTAPVTPKTVKASVPSAAKKALTATRSKTYARSAVRKVFGKKVTSVKVTCKVASSANSRCSVSFKKAGYSYKGNVWLRLKTVKSKLRWQYRTEVKKSRKGHKTVTVKRSYRTGGSF